MSWEKVTLGDIAEFSNGVNFGKKAYTKGVKLISVSSFSDCYYPEYNDLEEISEDVVKQEDFLQTGDIVFVRSNGNKELVGRCMLIENPPTNVTFSGFCIRARFKDLKKHDPHFWTYHFKSFKFRQAMSGAAVGTNIQNLSQGRMKVYETTIPDILVQKKIAGILLTYDNLIENNKKQIKLLEEMAQRLYKEWFVDLHFPGYEKLEIVDGVPEGWSNTQLDTVGKFIQGKTITKADTVGGNVAVVAGGKEPAYYNNISNTEEPVITISASGANAGFVRMYYERVWASDCSYVDKNNSNYIYYLYCFLKNSKTRINNLQKGAAQPHVYAKDINAMEMLVAPSELITSFESVVEPIFVKIKNCNEIIKRNIQVRDRLLPFLIAGKLEV